MHGCMKWASDYVPQEIAVQLDKASIFENLHCGNDFVL